MGPPFCTSLDQPLGTTMHPIGKLPVTMCLGPAEHSNEIHICPEVKGTLLSWRAARGLGVLPACYPQPCTEVTARVAAATKVAAPPTHENLMNEFPSIFNGNICVLRGENLHIALTEGATPFCVHTPRSMPFAYRDKLKVELDFLLEQKWPSFLCSISH